jgi:hypothetical protein
MAKRLAAQQIKTVIDAIKEGPKSWKQLKALRVGNKLIPEKSLHRILTEYLKLWGLAYQNQENRTWCCVGKRVFKNKYDYNLAIEHSRRILFSGDESEDTKYWPLPTTVALLQMFARPLDERPNIHLKEFLQHLKTGYPDLYAQFTEFTNSYARRGQILKRNLDKDPNFPKVWGKPIDKIDSVTYNSFMGYQFPTFLKEHHFSLQDELSGDALDSYKYAQESEWKQLEKQFSLEDFKNLEQLERDLIEIAEKALGRLSTISLKVEHGIPLEGWCEYCPHEHITIESEKQRPMVSEEKG